MTASLAWDSFGAVEDPFQTTDKLPMSSTTVASPLHYSGADQEEERKQIAEAQEWIKGVLDRAQTEFRKTMAALSAAIGTVNGLLGWDQGP